MIGSATALTQFSRQIGATIGVTVMGAIVNHGLPPGIGNGDEGATVHRLPELARQALADALKPAFFAAVCVSALVWVDRGRRGQGAPAAALARRGRGRRGRGRNARDARTRLRL